MLLWRENAINFASVWCDSCRSSLSFPREYARDSFYPRHSLLHCEWYWRSFQFARDHPPPVPYRQHDCTALTSWKPTPSPSFPPSSTPLGQSPPRYALRGTLDRISDLKRPQIVQTGLTTTRYYHLMALAAANVLFTVPRTIYMVVIDLRQDWCPYRGFADFHWGFGRVDSVAAVTPIPCALFAVFGFIEEACAHYKRAADQMARRFGLIVLGVHWRHSRLVVELSLWRDHVQDHWSARKPSLAFAVAGNGTRA
ncbi:hypothetical protein V8D89_008029 [Ganoderma adspersum]